MRTNRPPSSALHGGDAGAAFAVECAVDEAAVRLDEDPATFRRVHLRGPADPGGEALLALGEPRERGDARAIAELLRAGTRDSGRPPPLAPLFSRRSPAARQRGRHRPAGHRPDRRPRRGGFAAPPRRRLLHPGREPLDGGGRRRSRVAEAAAAILGVPAHRVVCAAADTDSAPFESGEAAPPHFSAGRAIEVAARLAHEQIRAAGAALLGAPVSEVALDGGFVRDATGKAVSFAEVGAFGLRSGQPVTATTAPAPAASPDSLAAAFAEVEVDSETGVVTVTRLSATLAGGPFADARPAEGQAQGALADAIEQALAGGLPFDAEGRPRVRSLRHFALAAAGDVPALSVTFLPGASPCPALAPRPSEKPRRAPRWPRS